MITDLAPYYAWWGVALAAATAWLGLRDRLVAGRLGWLSLLLCLVPLGMVAATGLNGFAGIVGPVWLIVLGVWLGLRRSPAAV